MKARERFVRSPLWNALLVGAVLLAGDAALRTVRAAPEEPPKVVTAQEFRLVDANGKTRATLAAKPDGNTTLTFVDTEGKMRAGLGLSEKGESSLRLYDA